MKFKSTVTDVPTLTKISQSLALLSKQAWIRLTRESVQFIVQPSGTQVWATIEVDAMFTSYFLESAADNVINLEVNVDSLGRLLRGLGDAGQVTLKLTKRDRYPMLSFATQYWGKQGGHNTVTHDLHVRVLSSAFMTQITEPQIPEPDVVILLPSLMHLLQISAPYKSLSDKLVLGANMNGEFTLGIQTPAVSTATLFSGLVHPVMNGAVDNAEAGIEGAEQQAARDKMQFCRLKVEARDWCNLLKIGSVAKRVIACFCAGHALILYVYVSESEEAQNSVITYYIATYQE